MSRKTSPNIEMHPSRIGWVIVETTAWVRCRTDCLSEVMRISPLCCQDMLDSPVYLRARLCTMHWRTNDQMAGQACRPLQEVFKRNPICIKESRPKSTQELRGLHKVNLKEAKKLWQAKQTQCKGEWINKLRACIKGTADRRLATKTRLK